LRKQISAVIAPPHCASLVFLTKRYSKALQMDPNYELGQSFAQKRMHDEAIAGVSESDRDFRTRWGLRHESRLRFCRFGKKDLEFRQDQNPSAEANIGLTYVGFDDQDQTMIRIEQGL
jgi:hypothetical protein